jgi:hypothetical protein
MQRLSGLGTKSIQSVSAGGNDGEAELTLANRSQVPMRQWLRLFGSFASQVLQSHQSGFSVSLAAA